MTSPNPPLIDSVRNFETRLKDLRKRVKAEQVSQIAKKSLRMAAEELGTEWFSSIEPELKTAGVDASLLLRYSERLQSLLKLASPNNLRTRYLAVLQETTRDFGVISFCRFRPLLQSQPPN